LKQLQAKRGALLMLEICLDTAPSSFVKYSQVAVEEALQFSSFKKGVLRLHFQAIQLLAAFVEHIRLIIRIQ
jgi:hypothetical protein